MKASREVVLDALVGEPQQGHLERVGCFGRHGHDTKIGFFTKRLAARACGRVRAMGAEVIPPPGNEPSDILSEDKEALADELADYTDDMPDSYYLLCDASAKVRVTVQTRQCLRRQAVWPCR